MPLQPGETLGAYEIVSAAGGGGGNELYHASDREHDRQVDIELFPAHFSERLDRDIPSLAALKHVNIREILDIGKQDDADYLVLEALEGQTLAQRIAGKPISLRDAMTMALEIAAALDAAHAAGLVHRNLTPSNILLTKSGVKLLDFGLADAPPDPNAAPVVEQTEAVPAPPKAAWGPAEAALLQYTAPEQFEGADPSAAGDVFSFGAILYEILTAQKAYQGKSRAVLIAALATAEPDPIAEFRPGAPPALQHLVERCLEKDPQDRWNTHDLLTQFNWIAGGEKALDLKEPVSVNTKRVRLALAAAAALIAVLATPAALYIRGPAPAAPSQFRIPTVGLSAADIAISPDGKTLALEAKANSGEAASLYVRGTGSLAFQKLGGTEDSAQPFFSPDSRYIGFVAGGRLKKVSVAGGAPQDLAEAASFSGGAWSAEGVILFGTSKGIFRVSDQGGQPVQVTAVEGQESGHLWPSFLPDGKHFLYLAWSANAADRAVYAGKLGSKDKTRIMPAQSNASYAAPGYVVFHRENSLFAQPFDPQRLALTGDQFHIADEVSSSSANGRGYFDVSQNGSLVYHQGGGNSGVAGRAGTLGTAHYGFLSRSGALLDVAGDTGPYGDFDLSPDGKLVAVTKQDSGSGADIWVIDWMRAGVAHQVTLDPADDLGPVWAPDSKRIAFTTYRKGNADIYVRNEDGTGKDTPLLDTPNDEIVKDWSKDGKYIAYLSRAEGYYDIWALPVEGGKPFPVIQGKYQKGEPQFSYDGKWLAYTSDESGGQTEVFVTNFPGADRKIQVSREGGGQPRWNKAGTEIYFHDSASRVLMSKITLGAKLDATPPAVLITRGYRNNSISRDLNRHQLSVSPDGQRFLVLIQPGANSSATAGTPGVPGAPANAVGGGNVAPAAANARNGDLSSALTVIEHWTTGLGKAAR